MSDIHPLQNPSNNSSTIATLLAIAFFVIIVRILLGTSNIEPFNGNNLKPRQEKVFDLLDVYNLTNYLTSLPP